MNAQLKPVPSYGVPEAKRPGYFMRCANRMNARWVTLLGKGLASDSAQIFTVVLLGTVFLLGFLPASLWIVGSSFRDRS